VEFGESAIKDDVVKEYISEAFAFVYVINSVSLAEKQLNRVRESSITLCGEIKANLLSP